MKELEASNAYLKVPVELRDTFQGLIEIDHKLSILNSMRLHLGVADIEDIAAKKTLGIRLMETLQSLCNGPIAGAYFPPEELRAGNQTHQTYGTVETSRVCREANSYGN